MTFTSTSTAPADQRAVVCAECGRTSPLTRTGDGTPKEWAYVPDAQITLCSLHKPGPPQGWQDVVQIYSATELNELAEQPGHGVTPKAAETLEDDKYNEDENDDEEYDDNEGWR